MSPNTRNEPTSSMALVNFMAEYGRSYLGSGGPTSRLEEDLMILGRELGFPTEVFASPTGVFVTCVDSEGTSHTTLARIKESGINLGRLCWLEGIFSDAVKRKISIHQANRILHSKIVRRPHYSMRQNVVAAYLFGFALSFPAYSSVVAALIAGFIAMATWWISGPGLRHKISSGIFRDFMGCATTLTLAGIFELLLPAPFEAYSIGGIIFLVPGLALTTAIAELADQNLVSGTAKLMQAVLTLLALALAYALFQDLSDALHLSVAPTVGGRPQPLLIGALSMAVGLSCFSVIFQIPPKSAPWAVLSGMCGWFIFKMFNRAEHVVAASFLASLSVGLISLYFGSRFRVPSQVFSVPGIVAMLPGLLALSSFRSFAMGAQDQGIELGVRVALTAGAIVFGLFSARIPYAYGWIRTKKD